MKIKVFIAFVVVVCSSGAYRHDISREKYHELAKNTDFNCCIRLVNTSDTSTVGSCVLISENWVLTAAHNVRKSDLRKDTIYQGKRIIVYYTPFNFKTLNTQDICVELDGKLLEVENIVIHPNYSDTSTYYDLCLIKLKSKCNNIKFPNINSGFDELGDTVISVGFGMFLPANTKSNDLDFKTKCAGFNVIDKIEGMKIHDEGMMMYSDMDNPTNMKKCNRMGSKIPLALEYIPTSGDSGSPLFKYKDNKLILLGICSGGGVDFKDFMKYSFYSQIGEWTRVSLFNTWITQTVKN